MTLHAQQQPADQDIDCSHLAAGYCATAGQGDAALAFTSCPGGSYNLEVGMVSASQCLPCPVGHYCFEGIRGDAERNQPNVCPIGSFNEVENGTDAGACVMCPQVGAFTTTATNGSSNASTDGATSAADCRCLAGEYMDAPDPARTWTSSADAMEWECVTCADTSADIICEESGLFLGGIELRQGFCSSTADRTRGLHPYSLARTSPL
jgi:hypothetical protein